MGIHHQEINEGTYIHIRHKLFFDLDTRAAYLKEYLKKIPDNAVLVAVEDNDSLDYEFVLEFLEKHEFIKYSDREKEAEEES
jgi:hypothetical protein